MTEGNGEAPVTQAQPVPFTVNVERIGTVPLGSGESVPCVRIIFFMPTGNTVLFAPAPFAAEIADKLREAAGGLTIAHDLGGLESL